MGAIHVHEFISLDGVVDAPTWTFEYGFDPKMGEAIAAVTKAAGGILLGRVTYEGFAAAWPSRDGEFAERFNTMPKYVVSSTLSDPEWTNTTVLSSDVPEEVAKLKEQHDGDVVVHGSRQLAQALLEHDLVDELWLMVFPVVLGKGERLFGETKDKKTLKLESTQTVGDGVVILESSALVPVPTVAARATARHRAPGALALTGARASLPSGSARARMPIASSIRGSAFVPARRRSATTCSPLSTVCARSPTTSASRSRSSRSRGSCGSRTWPPRSWARPGRSSSTRTRPRRGSSSTPRRSPRSRTRWRASSATSAELPGSTTS